MTFVNITGGLKMIVELINYTPEPGKTCLAAAFRCYSHESSKDLLWVIVVLLPLELKVC